MKFTTAQISDLDEWDDEIMAELISQPDFTQLADYIETGDQDG